MKAAVEPQQAQSRHSSSNEGVADEVYEFLIEVARQRGRGAVLDAPSFLSKLRPSLLSVPNGNNFLNQIKFDCLVVIIRAINPHQIANLIETNITNDFVNTICLFNLLA
jgi:hypothetical protein